MTTRAGAPRFRAMVTAVVVATLLSSVEPASAQEAGNAADAAALRTSQAAIGRHTTEHTFVDQHGRPLRLADLRGKPLVVSFVFTNCYVVCSGLTLNLREVVRIARGTLGNDAFGVLTLGFDSVHDTPPRMLAYGRDRGISEPDWKFASADAATVRRFTDELGFTWAPSVRGFDHVAQVTILDVDGVVVRQVYGEAFQPPELVEPLKQVILRRPVARASLEGLIERIRLYCTTYDPASRSYRFDYAMFAAGIPALFVLAMLALGVAYAARRKR